MHARPPARTHARVGNSLQGLLRVRVVVRRVTVPRAIRGVVDLYFRVVDEEQVVAHVCGGGTARAGVNVHAAHAARIQSGHPTRLSEAPDRCTSAYVHTCCLHAHTKRTHAHSKTHGRRLGEVSRVCQLVGVRAITGNNADGRSIKTCDVAFLPCAICLPYLASFTYAVHQSGRHHDA